ncbi:hypothetical protein [Lentilitoribacter sp. EG35]|uniref:hypothetical protein n=1 Tax=Lentilitoribacter sp. EG35 TaxID=3234192 RepID=UPI00345FD81D
MIYTFSIFDLLIIKLPKLAKITEPAEKSKEQSQSSTAEEATRQMLLEDIVLSNPVSLQSDYDLMSMMPSHRPTHHRGFKS